MNNDPFTIRTSRDRDRLHRLGTWRPPIPDVVIDMPRPETRRAMVALVGSERLMRYEIFAMYALKAAVLAGVFVVIFQL